MKPKTGEKIYREARLNKRAIDEEARTVELAFSSEEPVERAFGFEILDHTESSIRLGRIADGGAVLVDHDLTDHVGVVESVLVGEDRVARATVRFGRGARASEVFQDVIDGIRTKVSVGYVVHKFEEAKAEKAKPKEYRAMDWEPYEISIVSMPADVSVGVGRTFNHFEQEDINMSDAKTSPKTENREQAAPQAPAVNVKAEREMSAKAERERVNEILRVADEHGMADIARSFIDDGKPVHEFQREVLAEIGRRNNKIRSENPVDDKLDIPEKEKRQYSMLRIMRALAQQATDPANAKRAIEDAAFEFEVSDAAAKRLGIEPRGIFIPSEVALASRTLTAGTATDGAELVSDDLLAGSFIDVLRNTTVIAQAGARFITGLVGNVEIPRKTSASSGAWLATEDAEAAGTEPQFDQVTMSPHDLATYTEVSRRLIQQSTPSIEALIRDDLSQGMRIALDETGLYGSSGASGVPAGIAATSGINSVTFGSSQPTYAEVVQMVTECKLDNADMGATAFVTDPTGWDAAMTTEKATNTAQFIWNETAPNAPVVGRRAFVSNQCDSGDWFFGNWADLLVGFWGGLEVNVDPYTHSLRGRVRYVTFQTADMAVRHAVSFVRGNSGSTP
jgi:HK97 family phage major capsid protein